jgi:hypothetical protein
MSEFSLSFFNFDPSIFCVLPCLITLIYVQLFDSSYISLYY